MVQRGSHTLKGCQIELSFSNTKERLPSDSARVLQRPRQCDTSEERPILGVPCASD